MWTHRGRDGSVGEVLLTRLEGEPVAGHAGDAI